MRGEQHHRQGGGPRPGDEARHHHVIEREGEGEQPARDQGRRHQRQGDREEGPPGRGAEIDRRLLKLGPGVGQPRLDHDRDIGEGEAGMGDGDGGGAPLGGPADQALQRPRTAAAARARRPRRAAPAAPTDVAANGAPAAEPAEPGQRVAGRGADQRGDGRGEQPRSERKQRGRDQRARHARARRTSARRTRPQTVSRRESLKLKATSRAIGMYRKA